MKTVFVRYPLLCTGAFAGLLLVCSVAVHPFGTPKRVNPHAPARDGLNAPPEIAAVLNRSCMDCHSSQTVWPWYSYVAPMSWLVERDVRRGREHMNLSEWQQYTLMRREKIFADIASTVKNGEMPLPQYTLVHRQASLSDAERDVVYRWARTERRRLKAASQLPSPSTQICRAATPSTSKASSDRTADVTRRVPAQGN